jgi:hypothetical protein
MILYSVTDYNDIEGEWECAWYAAVWASSPEDAIKFGIENYGGEHHDAKTAGIRVMASNDNLLQYAPIVVEPTREKRNEVLRLAGWRHGEDDHQCDCCGLASMGQKKYEVCSECYLCKECRKDEDDPCEWCSGEDE